MTPQNDNTINPNPSDDILPTIGNGSNSINTATNVPDDHVPQPSVVADQIQSVSAHGSSNPANATSTTQTTTANNSFTPSIADDLDLIEKEWVNKAKIIVAKTKDDPRQQTEALHKFKADYIKKRYNKDIKVSES